MPDLTKKSVGQKAAEAKVKEFRDDLGPFVVAAETTRIINSRPAMIEMPGAVATSASRSMMMPKEWLRRRPINQPKVK